MNNFTNHGVCAIVGVAPAAAHYFIQYPFRAGTGASPYQRVNSHHLGASLNFHGEREVLSLPLPSSLSCRLQFLPAPER